jgi:deoxycytidine triphosphate deaminase
MPAFHEWKYVDPDRERLDRKGMLLSNQIKKFCEKGLLIAEEFEPKNLRPAAYTLRIGDKYVDSNGKPGTLDDKKPYFEMEPNSIVYVSTHEKLDLPFYIAARFNLRVKWVYKGILLGTGPQVEPGYRGYLSCPLYNLTDRPIRINYKEDFATIDFERTTDFCKGWPVDKIQASIKKGDELDEIEAGDETFLLFKQKEYPRLKHLPGYDVLSSLFEMQREVRTWRNIGIAFAVSFFALTLTLLGFGSNVFRQTTDLANDTKALRLTMQNFENDAKTLHSSMQDFENDAKQRQKDLQTLTDKVTALEKTVQASQRPRPAGPGKP